MAEGELPKVDGDVLYASEINLGLPYPYGDGNDGSATISSNTDLGQTIKNYTNLTIDSGFTLTLGHKSIIYVSGTLTLNGTIAIDSVASGGNRTTYNDSNQTGGAGGDSGGSVMIFANEITGTGTINANGVVGNNGIVSTDNGGPYQTTGDTGTFFDIVDISGSGATAATGFDGRSYKHSLFRMSVPGGSGEGRGTQTGGSQQGGSGGGGGGAGGYVFILTSNNNSTITINVQGADGGTGGEGSTVGGGLTGGAGGSFTTNGGDGGAGGADDGGGGGGGAGGFIIIFRDTTAFTTSVTAGSGGAGGTDGSAGSAGTAGTTIQYEIF